MDMKLIIFILFSRFKTQPTRVRSDALYIRLPGFTVSLQSRVEAHQTLLFVRPGFCPPRVIDTGKGICGGYMEERRADGRKMWSRRFEG